MSKLIAGDALRAAHARLQDEGDLSRYVDVIGMHMDQIKANRKAKPRRQADPLTFDPNEPEYDRFPAVDRVDSNVVDEHTTLADVNGGVSEAVESILTSRTVNAETKARLRAYSASRRQDPREHPPGRPTEEFLSKSGGEKAFDISISGRGERAPSRRYVLRAPTESFRKHLPADVENAFVRFSEDAEAAGVFHVTANYDGVGGGSYGPRVGGLGDVEQTDRDAYQRHMDRLRLLGALLDTPDSRLRAENILAWAILRERPDSGRAMTLEYLGEILCPDMKSPDAKRGAARQAIEMVGRLLVNVDHLIEGRKLRIRGGGGIDLNDNAHAYVTTGSLGKKPGAR